MPAVKTSTIIDGMVLADDVSVNGAVSLPAGTILRSVHAQKLVAAGIRQIRVTDESYGLAYMVAEPEPAPAKQPTRTGNSTVQTGKTPNRPVTEADSPVSKNLLRLAHMFEPYRDEAIMRRLCRLAIKAAREGLISG